MDTYEWWFGPLAALLAYLAGSLSFAVIVSRLMNLDDPRSYGSGNPGATNVLRSGNKIAAALTLLFDGLKAFIPLWCVQQYGTEFGLSGGTVAAVAIAAFLGHLFPVFFQVQRGQRRGNGDWRELWHPSASGCRNGADLAHHRVLFPLFIARRAGGCGLHAGVLPAV